MGFSGPTFEKAKESLSARAMRSFRHLTTVAATMAPQKYKDELSADQATRFVFVTSPDQWEAALADFSMALEQVPVLSVGLVLEDEALAYVAIGTYNGRVAAFAIAALSTAVPGWLRRADVLPAEVRVWLLDERHTVIHSGQGSALAQGIDGLRVANAVDSEEIYQIYRNAGVIAPTFQTQEADLKWQMAFAADYHHRPSTKFAFEQLLGENKYPFWPVHRRPGWKPVGADSDPERFFFYFEALGPQIFINHLLRYGILYGRMKAVRPNLPLDSLYAVFLDWVRPREEVVQQDPLMLQSDHLAVGEAVQPPLEVEPADEDEGKLVVVEEGDGGLEEGEVLDEAVEVKQEEKKKSPARSVVIIPPPTKKQVALKDLQKSLMRLAGCPVVVTAQEEEKKPQGGYYTRAGLAQSTAVGIVPNARDKLEAGPSRPKGDSPRYSPYDCRLQLDMKRLRKAYEEESKSPVRAALAIPQEDENIKLMHNLQQRAREGRKAAPRLPYAPDDAYIPPINKDKLQHDILSPEEARENVFALKPRFHRRCVFCGASHCSKFLQGSTDPNCRKYREQRDYAATRAICTYRRCLAPHEHQVAVCPALHGRCESCGCRGHTPGDMCDIDNAPVMARLRADFEEAASAGVYTRRRFDNVGWGFYPYPAHAPADGNIVSYRRLSDEPVLEAILLMRSLVGPAPGGQG